MRSAAGRKDFAVTSSWKLHQKSIPKNVSATHGQESKTFKLSVLSEWKWWHSYSYSYSLSLTRRQPNNNLVNRSLAVCERGRTALSSSTATVFDDRWELAKTNLGRGHLNPHWWSKYIIAHMLLHCQRWSSKNRLKQSLAENNWKQGVTLICLLINSNHWK